MKSILRVGLFYFCLALLVAGCSESDPEPACIQAEVIGPDNCGSDWYLLKLENDISGKSNSYVGQLQSGYVTTNNLPDEYKQPGLKINVALDLLEEGGSICLAVYMVYPAVSVKRVCAVTAAKSSEG